MDPLTLLTPRLLLRPYEAADAPSFFAVLDGNRERLAHSFPDRLRTVASATDAPDQLAAFAHDWQTGRFYVFGIWLRESRQYVGDICLMPQRDGQAEIGYYLAAEAEGQGYAREALAAVVPFGFKQVQATRLLIRCYADNLRGQAVARSQGFAVQESTFSFWRRLNLRRTSTRPEILHFVRVGQ